MSDKKTESVRKATDSSSGSSKAIAQPVPGDVGSQPILRYKVGGEVNNSNLFLVKVDWDLHLRHEYGRAGGFLLTQEHWIPPVVPLPELATSMSELEKEATKDAYKESVKIRQRHICENEEKYSRMYAFMIGKMSSESRDRAKTDSEWNAVETSQDPLKLWKLLLRTHHETSRSCTALSIKAATDSYGALRQGKDSLGNYKVKIENALQVLKAVGAM